ncbi:MAG: TMEM143 family protein [Planctomycetota bacterium]|nr:TMEM143 family protein [Planctomycetota bacterium]
MTNSNKALQSTELAPTRFIPFRRNAVVTMLGKDGQLDESQRANFRELARIVGSYYHFQFHHKLEILKDAYFPFDPDLDVESLETFTDEEREERSRCLTAMLTEVLNDANYEAISQQDVLDAFLEENLIKLSLTIDFDDFEECLVYGRGNVVKEIEVKRFFFFKKKIKVETFERVVLFLRFKNDDHFNGLNRKTLNFTPSSTLIKIFKDMPRADLEMLFPNTQLKMHTRDKLLLGVPAIGGAVPVLLTKVLPHLPIIFSILFGISAGKKTNEGKWIQAAIHGGLAMFALGAYSWRQWEKFKNRRLMYLKALTENLYFKNLDNNAGVFFRLIDSAEEEEFKEALIAYYFLMTEGPQESTALDQRIEKWFLEKHQTRINFEVEGALEKLITLGIASKDGTIYSVLPLEEAKRKVDSIWDGFFDYPETSKDCDFSEKD